MLLYASIFVLTASLAIYASLRYVRYDRRLSVLTFGLLMVSISFWELSSFLLEMVTSEQLKLIAHNISNIITVPLYLFALLFFSLALADHRRWIKWGVVGFAITITGLSVLLVFDPEFLYESRGLVTRAPVTILGVTFEEYVVHDRQFNRSFRVFGLYSYLITLLSAGILVRYIIAKADDLHTEQSLLIGTGIGTPLILNGMEVYGMVPPALRVTEIGFGVTAICFALGIFRYNLFELPPIRRQQLLSLIDDPLVFVDDKNEIAYSNPPARQIFDAGPRWKGLGAIEFFGPYAERIQPLRSDEPTQNSTIKLDGSERYFDVRSTTIRTSTGETRGRAIVFREITDIKKTNQRLDEFASMVSHDLRTPLNNAAVQTNRLARDQSDERTEGIQRALDRMESIIDDMLQLARVGDDIETTETCSLAELVEEVWETVETDDAELDCRVGETTVEADPVRLFQALENLFRNALDHNDSPLTVRVGTLKPHREIADADAPTGFFIEDDGHGIDEDEQDEIFEHGYTTRQGGNGYGLSIVRYIVDAHDWEIRVTEGTDGGARFEIVGIEADQFSAHQSDTA